MAHLAPPPPRTMLGGTIHDTEASPRPTAHDVKDTARRASYNSSTRPCRALHGPGMARAYAPGRPGWAQAPFADVATGTTVLYDNGPP